MVIAVKMGLVVVVLVFVEGDCVVWNRCAAPHHFGETDIVDWLRLGHFSGN